MIPPDTHLQIGSLLFEGLDQIDLTGPFEVSPRIPNSTHRLNDLIRVNIANATRFYPTETLP